MWRPQRRVVTDKIPADLHNEEAAGDDTSRERLNVEVVAFDHGNQTSLSETSGKGRREARFNVYCKTETMLRIQVSTDTRVILRITKPAGDPCLRIYTEGPEGPVEEFTIDPGALREKEFRRGS